MFAMTVRPEVAQQAACRQSCASPGAASPVAASLGAAGPRAKGCLVTLRGVPKMICSNVAFLEAMFEQAGLEHAVLNFEVLRSVSSASRDLRVSLSSREVAQRCVEHFAACDWVAPARSKSSKLMASRAKPRPPRIKAKKGGLSPAEQYLQQLNQHRLAAPVVAAMSATSSACGQDADGEALPSDVKKSGSSDSEQWTMVSKMSESSDSEESTVVSNGSSAHSEETSDEDCVSGTNVAALSRIRVLWADITDKDEDDL